MSANVRWRWRRGAADDRFDAAVLDEATVIGRALDGGLLAGRAVTPLRIDQSLQVAFAVTINPAEVREAWRAARPRRTNAAAGRW